MEINREHIKTCRKIRERDGDCTGLFCDETCPFSSENDPNGRLCGDNDFYKKDSMKPSARAGQYIEDCEAELRARFNRLIDYCNHTSYKYCIIVGECALFSEYLTENHHGINLWQKRADKLIGEIIEGD